MLPTSILRAVVSIPLAALLLGSGCGSEQAPAPSSDKGPAASATSPSNPIPAASAEVGPDGPADLVIPAFVTISTDPAAITRGEGLFGSKGCAGCHQFGAKLVGPDLVGLFGRRSVPWVQRMILHPQVMVKKDPVAKALFRTAMVEMPNQGVTEAELADLLAFIQNKAGGK